MRINSAPAIIRDAVDGDVAAIAEFRRTSTPISATGRQAYGSCWERIGPGITFARELGQQLVVLAPSVVVRPSVALTDYGPAMIICYPAAADSLASDKPPERLVLLGKALGDELRLRALRELRDGPMSASQLARRLGIPRTTIHHHISLLLRAGLARMSVDDARTGNVSLRKDAINELGELAEGWLSEPE